MLNTFWMGLILWRALPNLLLLAASLFMAADLWWPGGMAILVALLWLSDRHINAPWRKHLVDAAP